MFVDVISRMQRDELRTANKRIVEVKVRFVFFRKKFLRILDVRQLVENMNQQLSPVGVAGKCINCLHTQIRHPRIPNNGNFL